MTFTLKKEQQCARAYQPLTTSQLVTAFLLINRPITARILYTSLLKYRRNLTATPKP